MSNENFPYAKYAMTGALGLLLSYHLLGAILVLAFGLDNGPYALLSLTGISQLLVLLLPVWFFAKLTPLDRKILLRIDRLPNQKQVIFGIIAVFAFQFLSTGFQAFQFWLIPDSLIEDYIKLIESIRGVYAELFTDDSFLGLITMLLFIAVIPAVCEEFLIRGFLQRSLEERFRPFIAILISSIVFAGMHLNPVDFIPLVLIAFVFGYSAYFSGSIVLPIILHFLNNAFATIVVHTYGTEEFVRGELELPLEVWIPSLIFGGLATYFFTYLVFKYRSDNGNRNIQERGEGTNRLDM